MYLVTVTHATGHEPATVPVILTADLDKAVERARDTEGLGYKSYTGHTVSLYNLTPEYVYQKAAYHWIVDCSPPHDMPSLLCRTKTENGWEEEWFNPLLERQFSQEAMAESSLI